MDEKRDVVTGHLSQLYMYIVVCMDKILCMDMDFFITWK